MSFMVDVISDSHVHTSTAN